MTVNSSSIPALRAARAAKKRRRAEGGGVGWEEPVYPDVGEAAIPDGGQLFEGTETGRKVGTFGTRLSEAVLGIPKSVLWDAPHKLVGDSRANYMPGLRREDYTDIPADTSPDPKSPLGGVGITVRKPGWQPVDPMVGGSLEAAMNVMGGTALTAPGNAVGAGPSKLKAALDMSEEARLARAAEQGFDTSAPVYHGTSKDADFKKFKDSRHGTWTTTSPEEASGYARQNDSKGYRMSTERGAKPWDMEAVNSADRVIPLYAKPLENPYVVTEMGFPEHLRTASNYKKAQSEWFDQLKRAGHDGVIMPGGPDGSGIRVDFDNANLRGQFAPFDPRNEGKSVIFGAGSTDKRAASAATMAEIDRIIDSERAAKGAINEPAQITAPAGAAGEAVGPGGGGTAGARSLPEAQAAAARWAGERKPLEGIPGALKIGEDYFVPGPIGKIHDVAEDYMRTVGADRPYLPPTRYHPIDPEHSKAIAQAYEEMKHTPNDPATKASYDALIDETAKQYDAIKKTGLKIEPIPAGAPDPYATNPRLAAWDVAENNHLWFFPTESGFGTVNKITDNPMLRKTGEKIGDHELLANDMFRIVHDYFGHLKQGHGFRAAGEDNAWRTHAAMYSDIARPAMTTETRGQNSWVNYGPHGDKNRTASAADTVYADQKVGLMPDWTMYDRGKEPLYVYTGSPHKYDRPDISKVGIGEGNQAYGHGLYSAGHEPVAERYRHALSTMQDPLLKNYKLQDVGHVIGGHLADAGGDAIKLADEYRRLQQRLIDNGTGTKADANMIAEYDRRIEYLLHPERAKGYMYKQALEADPAHLLDYDIPFKEQSQHVQGRTGPMLEESVRRQTDAIKQSLQKGTSGTGRWERPLLAGARAGLEGRLLSLEQLGHSSFPGKEIYKRAGLPAKTESEGAVKATERLRGMGIPGLRYLDAGSRVAAGQQGAKGTHNYVVFDDNMLRILRRYGVVGIPAVGVMGADGEIRRAEGGAVVEEEPIDHPITSAGRALSRGLKDMAYGMVSLPKRAFEASEAMRGGYGYDPEAMVEAATLPMGTGAIAGVPVKGAEAVLGSGFTRRIADDTGAAMPAVRRSKPYAEPEYTEGGSRIINRGVESTPDPSIQTVADPYRMMYPGIYRNPRIVAEEAAARVGPEDPAMKQLFGVTRGDLREMAQGRVGNEDPRLHLVRNPKGSLAAQNIQTPQNTQRLIDILEEGGKHEGLRTADAWYIMDPVYKRMVELFGPEEAAVRYRRFNTLTGMASPGSDVVTEINRGTAAHWLNEKGRFEDFRKYAGIPEAMRYQVGSYPRDMMQVPGHPYHRTSQGDPMGKYLAAGEIQSKSPKVPLYVHASGVPETGFQTSGPVGDAHFSRGVGLADTRKGPTDVGASFSTAEYQTLQPWWQHEVARAAGLESVPAQARLWTALGPQTGVESALGAPKLELLASQIMQASRRLGISPEKARDLVLSGRAGAFETGGAVVDAAMDAARSIRRAKGGAVHLGPITGDTGGRADKVPMSVPNGAYVLTADHVSGMGEGNTAAGMKKMSELFPKSKPSRMRSLPDAVPILAADGEFVISPEDIIDQFGDLEYGHRTLDEWQTSERQRLIETLQNLAPPAQD